MLAISRKPERLVDAANRQIQEIHRCDSGDHTIYLYSKVGK